MIPVLLASLDRVLIYALVLFVLGYTSFKRQDKLFDYFLAILTTLGLSETIKYFVDKPRPTDLFEGSSFPSSHTALAFMCAAFVCHVMSFWGRGKKRKKGIIDYLVCFCVLLAAVTVAVLRVYVGAHDVIDTFSGMILGIIVATPFGYYDVAIRREK